MESTSDRASINVRSSKKYAFLIISKAAFWREEGGLVLSGSLTAPLPIPDGLIVEYYEAAAKDG
jgi:hypothetical protein